MFSKINMYNVMSAIHNHSFCMEIMSTDWTSSSQARIWSKISSVSTLSSSMTHPICSFWIPKATYTFLGWLFQTKPSIFKANIFWASSSKLVTSASYILTSKTTIDLATGLGLAAFAGFGWGFSTFFAGTSASSAKGSKSSSLVLGASVFLTSAGLLEAIHFWRTTGVKELMNKYQ